MLVLSRKAGQSIVIANDVEVKVLAVEKGVVRIGVVAPSDVPVWRDEIYQRLTHKEKFGDADKQ